MKRIISTIMIVVALASTLMLSSCGGEVGICEFCGEEFKVNQMHERNFFDETVYVCDECNEELEEAFGA